MSRCFRAAMLTLACSVLWAQQTGTVSGTVTASSGEALPGVTVSAESAVLPQPRSTVTNELGRYRLGLLPPGDYTLTYTMSNMGTVKRETKVLLDQTTTVDVSMNTTTEETMTVTATHNLIDTESAELSQAIDSDTFDAIPLGQEYRDLVKLVPGIQVTQNGVRGPSAGGSGQDNIYKFDGVDVTLPLFGTLSAEPSNHDIEQISIVKGGAKAINFNRSGGFLINSISKSGTNSLRGEISYQAQLDSWRADEDRPPTELEGESESTWLSANIGGPIVKDRLFFYASYYAPEVDLTNRSNAYGPAPDGKSERDEFFIKLTLAPNENLLLHASYRDSSKEFSKSNVFSVSAPTVTAGSEADQTIAILEGNWIINAQSNINFKYTDYALDTLGRPDILLSVQPTNAASAMLDVNNLDQMGYIQLPTYRSDEAYNDAVRPFIERYGFVDESGTRQGGGRVGAFWEINDQDFTRTEYQIGYNYYFTAANMDHDFHVGYRYAEDAEDLTRTRNGWGIVSFTTNVDELIQAEFLRSEGVGVVHSEYQSENIELNDNITMGAWNFNLGVMLSHDELFGQDLANDSSTVSGFRVERGTQYEMYDIGWNDMVQPRLGVVWNYNKTDTLQASVAWYNPPATSLPRAASWARNYNLLRTRVWFDQNGEFVRTQDVSSSSGKFFQPNMTPRRIEEYVLGWNAELNGDWTLKATARHRYAHHFWEDTNNDARISFADTATDLDPEEIRSGGLYIPELDDYRAEVGGSSYVIAELDGAFTRYYEATVDVEKRTEDYYLKGTYTWSHYYGNFDQDNTTVENDQNIFIGSSNYADGVGRQVWDYKYGNLAGDRRHMLKVFGSYNLPWGSRLGAFAFYQDGQPWETWDVETYRAFTSSSSSTIRFSEPAGSRRSSDHYQLDLSLTHDFRIGNRYNLQVDLDIFNVFDKQTGYAIDPVASSVTYGQPNHYWAPRRYQLAIRFQF
ncbi:MAG: TonB-dependent receptor [Acidobacteria bacterium]|nr:TonB-dependent receptor [Acidobacteriota bacterium]